MKPNYSRLFATTDSICMSQTVRADNVHCPTTSACSWPLSCFQMIPLKCIVTYSRSVIFTVKTMPAPMDTAVVVWAPQYITALGFSCKNGFSKNHLKPLTNSNNKWTNSTEYI